jgi:hypothetical protein
MHNFGSLFDALQGPAAEPHRTNQPDLQALFRTFNDCLDTQRDLLIEMRDLLAVLATRARQRDPVRQTFTLANASGEPYQFSKRGYKHCRIRCPAASTTITVEELGVSVPFTLPAGWSVLDPGEGARLWVTNTGAAVTITLEWTDEVVQ